MPSPEKKSLTSYKIAAFYCFAPIADPAALQAKLQSFVTEHHMLGTVLVASEGINGTVAASPEVITKFVALIHADARFQATEFKYSFSADAPFYRAKVRLKKEIISMGVGAIEISNNCGTYVEPAAWNELIADPDTIVVDTRNDYEVSVGTFERAIDPDIKSFRQFPAFVTEQLAQNKDKKIAMFCTGGIRCEKAVSYLVDQGFEKVYQLHGGILKYLEEVAAEESRWQGECFVFDQRVSVDHSLQRGEHQLCHACRSPLSAEDCASPLYVEGVSCVHCYAEKDETDRARFRERQKQIKLAAERNCKHLG